MFQLQLTAGNKFMKVKNLIREVGCCEAIVNISSTALSLHAKEPSNVGCLVFHLNPTAFDHFYCDQNISIGIGIHWLFNILECASYGDIIEITGGNVYKSIFLTIRGNREDETVRVDLKVLRNLSWHPNIYRGEYNVTVEMPSEEFKCVCNILRGFSNKATISVANETVKFSTKDNGFADANLLQKYINILEVPKETATVQTDLTYPVSLTFSLMHSNSFTVATSLSKTVLIRMSKGVPVVLEYTFEQKGYLRYYLN